MSQKNSIGQSGPASITHNHVRRPVRSVQELADALGDLPILPSGTAPEIVANIAGPAYGPRHPGHARFAAALTDDGSPSMLAEPTRTIMAGNGIIEAPEAFDEFTGPGCGIVEKIHGNPLGEIAHAVIVPPEPLSSASGAMTAPRATSTPAACASVAGGFTLSDNQRASIREMAIRATASGNFDVLCLSIESLVLHEQVQQLGRTIERVDAAVQGAFAKADSTVREVCRDAKASTVARCNACPKCGKEIECIPAEPDVNIEGGYECSDPDCGWSAQLDG